MSSKSKRKPGEKSNEKSKKLKLNGGEDENLPLTLVQIKDRVHKLVSRIPPISEVAENDIKSQQAWAIKLHAILEEFNLCLSSVSPCTYRWSSERSGAADHNLAHLSAELSNAQDQLSSVISNKLSNVLCPVVDLVTAETKIVTTKSFKSKKNNSVDGTAENGEHDGEEEIKIQTNTLKREIVDPGFHQLCGNSLFRNAEMITRVLRANLEKAVKVIGDYIKDRNKEEKMTVSSMAY